MSVFLRCSSRAARQLCSFSKFTSTSLSRKPQENIYTTTHASRARFLHLTLRDLEKVTVQCPAFAESITEGDIQFEKGVGDSCDGDEILAEIETDKTTIPVLAPVSGVVVELLVENGSTVNPGASLMTLDSEGGSPAAKEAPKVAAEPPKAEPSSPPEPIPATLPPVPPVPREPLTTTDTADVKVTPRPPPSGEIGSRGEHRVKMNRMRQRIATRLKDAQNTAAMLTTFNEVDMSTLMALRSKHKAAFFERHGVKLSFMSAFIKASTYALQEQPVVNAVIDGSEIVYRDYVDVSVAVSTSRGLVVPVMRNCERMSFLDIEREMGELAGKARGNSLTVEDMDGGTFTVSNGGVFGSVFGTPIINLPQSSILGMHGIFDRPVAVAGEVRIRPMMYVALTYDHRLIDGREAVSFLRKIKEGVEDPSIFLLGM